MNKDLDIKYFFCLGDKPVSSTVQAHPKGLNNKDDNGNRDPDINRLFWGDYSGITFPVVFKQEYGKKLNDMLGIGWPGIYLISDKMCSILEENQFTGWKTYPILLLDKKCNIVKGYQGLSITGRCGSIDYKKSKIIEKSTVEGGPISKYYIGLHVGLDKWDGSDFFLPVQFHGTIITSRVAEALKKNKLTNIELENLADYETWDFILKVGKKEV